MDIIDSIEELVSKMYERGEEIAPFIYVDQQTYRTIKVEMLKQSYNSSVTHRFVVIEVITTVGCFQIKCDSSFPTNTVRNNGRTLLDIVVEEELLGI